MRLIKNFSNSLFKSFSFTDIWIGSYLQNPTHHSQCPFQMCILHVLLIDTSGETSHVSTYDITGIGLPTLSQEGIQAYWMAFWHHMSSSSSSSWEDPTCWAVLADAAAICACWAACCICNHSCWASSACCCRACRYRQNGLDMELNIRLL